jgi:hypothetical protein
MLSRLILDCHPARSIGGIPRRQMEITARDCVKTPDTLNPLAVYSKTSSGRKTKIRRRAQGGGAATEWLWLAKWPLTRPSADGNPLPSESVRQPRIVAAVSDRRSLRSIRSAIGDRRYSGAVEVVTQTPRRGRLISNLLQGEKVLRYEADEGSLIGDCRIS